MSVAFLKRSSDSARNFSTDWETKLLCSSSSASSSPLQVPTNETDSTIFKAENLRQKGLYFAVGQEELIWWVNNLKLSNGRSLVNSKPQIIITSDASLKGWGASCQGQSNRGP